MGTPADGSQENLKSPLPGNEKAWESSGVPDSPPDTAGTGNAGEINRLKALLFKKELELLEDLRRRVQDPAGRTDDISSVIAEALALRSRKDERLKASLEPMVEDILKDSLKRNPRRFADVFFPLMGPSIRKSISETLRSMLESFSKTMELAFTRKGLRWRFEALRTGKSFSEVVLLHTLVYRVEKVFFIHAPTGIDLAVASDSDGEELDASMISAMLTAIQDFVRDCFASGSEGDLESLKHGEFTVFLERSNLAYIACVVRGTPPGNFQEQMRACLDVLLMEFSDELENFEGDIEPFEPAALYLERLLSSRFVDDDSPLPVWSKILPVVVLLFALSYWGINKYFDSINMAAAEKQRAVLVQERSSAVEILRKEPGLMLINVPYDLTETPLDIFCTKDSLARSPEEVLKSGGIDPAPYHFHTVPYVAYDPVIVQRRVKAGIEPPDTVELSLKGDGTLVFTGTAPMEWTLSARQTSLSLPGVKHVDMSGLVDPRMGTIRSLLTDIESTSVRFPLGRDVPVPGDAARLSKAVDDLVELEKLASEMGMSVSLTIYGHADAVGNEKRNYEISQARAKTVAAMLYSRGSYMPVSTYGLGAEHAAQGEGQAKEDPDSRRIELRVRLTGVGGVVPESLH